MFVKLQRTFTLLLHVREFPIGHTTIRVSHNCPMIEGEIPTCLLAKATIILNYPTCFSHNYPMIEGSTAMFIEDHTTIIPKLYHKKSHNLLSGKQTQL